MSSPSQVHLAGVDPGPELDAERGRVVEDGGRAADRLAGSVEGGQQAVRGGLDQAAAVVADQVSWRASRSASGSPPTA